MPQTLKAHIISKSVADIGKFLKNPALAAPFPTLENEKLKALKKLAELFRRPQETDTDTYAHLRVESDQVEYISERPRHSIHINPTP